MIKKINDVRKKQTNSLSKIMNLITKILLVLVTVFILFCILLLSNLVKFKIFFQTVHFIMLATCCLSFIAMGLILVAEIKDTKFKNLSNSYCKIAMLKKYELPEIKPIYQKPRPEDFLQKTLKEIKAYVNEISDEIKKI